jgi:DNA-binding response OmpR family regulator
MSTSSSPPLSPLLSAASASAFDRSVLIVDDDPITAAILADGLRSQGWRVEIAWSAEEALEVIGSVKPGVVVLDLVLPFMSGIMLARQIKSAPATQDVAIVAVANVMDGETEKLVHDAGCMTCLKKPPNPRFVGYLLRGPIWRLGRADERRQIPGGPFTGTREV